MTIVRDDAVDRETRVDRMVTEFREAQSRRDAKRRTHVVDPRAADAAPATHHVPPEYVSLYTYLGNRSPSIVVLTFDQMEAVLGFALPASARTQPDWWAGPPVRCLCHSSAWTETGRTATPDLPRRTVTFERSPDRRGS